VTRIQANRQTCIDIQIAIDIKVYRQVGSETDGQGSTQTETRQFKISLSRVAVKSLFSNSTFGGGSTASNKTDPTRLEVPNRPKPIYNLGRLSRLDDDDDGDGGGAGLLICKNQADQKWSVPHSVGGP